MAVQTKTLSDLRSLAENLADMAESDFISTAEWQVYINLGIREFYDKLGETHGQEFLLRQSTFPITKPKVVYDLPDDFHLLKGVDFSQASFDATPEDSGLTATGVYEKGSDRAIVPLKPYNFRDRNDYSIHGADSYLGTPLRYRVFTDLVTLSGGATEYRHRIRFSDAATGYIAVWYIPEPPTLCDDTDEAVFWNGYEIYPSLYAAKLALQKEESDASVIMAELQKMEKRLETMAANRDVGEPGRIAEPFYGDFWRRP